MNILIVRPSLDAKILMEKFSKKGIKSNIFPIISFKKGKEIKILPKIINNLPKKSIIIFVSKQAIKYTINILQEKKITWPKKFYFYTIGYHSSLLLKKYIPYKVQYPIKKENSEELLKILVAKKNIKKKKILILKGNNGNILLQKKLIQHGCDVSIIECYQQIFHSYKKINNKNINFSKINTLIVTSNNILVHLYNLFYKKNKINWLLNCKIFCIGLNMKKKAKKLGWKKIYFLEYSNNEFIYKKILYFFRRKRI